MKKLISLGLVVVILFSMVSCGNSADTAELQTKIEALEQENENLKSQLNNGDVEEEQSATTETTEDTPVSSDSGTTKETENDKFDGITVTVTEKNIIEEQFSDFIEMVYIVENSTDKDIKGIEGVMHIKDMFGKDILSLNWDTLKPIPANSSETFNDFGLKYNQFMTDHSKVYNTDFDSLIFEFEFKTVIFEDGSTIS